MAVEEHSPQDAEGTLKDHGLWEGWSQFYTSIPLGPDKSLELESPDRPDPDIVGFAYPLPPVAFHLRNERRFPPPAEIDMLREMYMLVQVGLGNQEYQCDRILSIIYGHINSNRRDSPGWQRAFIKAGGAKALSTIWRQPEKAGPGEADAGAGHAGAAASAVDEDGPSSHYWVVAVLGRMLGTSQESRNYLIAEGAIDIILEATRLPDEEVRDCAVCALKGLIQFPEGREKVSYTKLIECLGLKG